MNIIPLQLVSSHDGFFFELPLDIPIRRVFFRGMQLFAVIEEKDDKTTE